MIDDARAKALSCWMTPPDLARRIVEWAQPKGYVLEPSCGTKNIAHAINPFADVTTIDIAEEFSPGIVGNYLECKFNDVWDMIVMNPPYEDGLDLKFLEKAAYDAQEVVALVRLNALAGQKRYESVWRHVSIGALAILSSRPSFFLVDRETGSPRHDFVVVRYSARLTYPSTKVEWW